MKTAERRARTNLGASKASMRVQMQKFGWGKLWLIQ
jgi:hypothetical protein